MDVTPQVINEVEFHQKMRGYDPDEVDDFLERVAVAVGQLTDRLQEAEARAATAERRAIDSSARCASSPSGRPSRSTGGSRRSGSRRRDRDDPAHARARAEHGRRRGERSAGRSAAHGRRRAGAGRHAAQRGADDVATARERRRGRGAKASEETRQRMIDEIVALEETREALQGRPRHPRAASRRATTALAQLDRRPAAPARRSRPTARVEPARAERRDAAAVR